VSKPQAANSVPEPVAAPKSFELFPPLGTKATCPVMGGAFSIKETSDHSEYKGRHYFFCCPGCKPSFDENPEKYLR
jgi:YHS domain-containing protein